MFLPPPEEQKPEEQKLVEHKLVEVPEILKDATIETKQLVQYSALLTFVDLIRIYSEAHKSTLSPAIQSQLLVLTKMDPVFLTKIEDFFGKLIQDKKINVLDLPVLAAILQELYLLFLKSNIPENTPAQNAEVLKILVHILVSNQLSNSSNSLSVEEKDGIVNSLDLVLSSCISLMELNTLPIMKKCCCF
jgi:hypothetical protein